MKFIKNHLMFILPMMAILLGIEVYLVFNRTTDMYEKKLKEGYAMLVVTKKPITLNYLKKRNTHIAMVQAIKRDPIVSKVTKGVNDKSKKEILAALPYFYNVGLDSYLGTHDIEKIKKDLENDKNVKRVETFGNSYDSTYRLFSFVKLLLNVFVGFIGVVSLLLVIKQMEIWKYVHQERMQVMEIFGAPLMLRSGVLFRIAVVDALIATLLTSGLFFYVKYIWAPQSGIDLIVQKHEALFLTHDFGILAGAALLLVIIAVYAVVVSSKGVRE